MTFFLSEIGSGHLELLEKRKAHPIQDSQAKLFLGVPCHSQNDILYLPCERRFLSCMASSVYDVVHVACQSRIKSTPNAN